MRNFLSKGREGSARRQGCEVRWRVEKAERRRRHARAGEQAEGSGGKGGGSRGEDMGDRRRTEGERG
eukprot:4044333-Pleurochrysis_carterae.AAC.1